MFATSDYRSFFPLCSCNWELEVRPDISLDLMCQFLFVPCSSSDSLDFLFSLPEGDSNAGATLGADEFCDDKFYQDVNFR